MDEEIATNGPTPGESLFRSSLSFNEYKDETTLKKRLQKLALDMGIRAREVQASNGQAQGGQAMHGMQIASGGQGGPVRQSDINPMMARQGAGNMPQGSQSRPHGQSQQSQEQRQQVLRQQQQRLLLLRHASKCPHGESQVPVTKENHSEGARVKRGPDWKWGDQDGGPNNYGILGATRGNGWTIVTWERRDGVRQEREYRIGGEISMICILEVAQ